MEKYSHGLKKILGFLVYIVCQADKLSELLIDIPKANILVCH